MTGRYEALVYDLDGTLVRLEVDWDEAAEAVAAILRPRGIDTAEQSLWEMLDRARGESYYRHVEATLADHERDGARNAKRLPAAADLPTDVPVAVCSLNCEAACRIALELHGLDREVDAIVGRDTVDTQKPDPEALLAAVDAIDADPRETLFVGDSESDELTADRAGIDFEYVETHS